MAARITRSLLSPAISWVQPLPSVPSSASSGTRTSSRCSSFVSSPPMVLIGVIVKPSASRGTKTIDRPSCLSEPSPVRQTIRVWLALWA